MFTNPKSYTTEFQSLRAKCDKKKLQLYCADNKNIYKSIGGNYAVYCRRSGMKLFAADRLQHIADHLKIGGVYD